MACACKSNKNVAAREAGTGTTAVSGGTVPISVEALPHTVLPGESCIFCADKHVSTAYSMYQSGVAVSNIIGDLELARRHTLREFPAIARDIAEMEYHFCIRDYEYPVTEFPKLISTLQTAAAAVEPDEETSGDSYSDTREPVMNPFVGELLVCGAMRLVYEVGYIFLNRAMAVGDLSVAGEHLAYYRYELCDLLRDMRHRIQTARYSDMNEQWNTATKAIDAMIKKSLADFREKHGQALRDYLGL